MDNDTSPNPRITTTGSTSTDPTSTGSSPKGNGELTQESLDEFRRGFEADAPKKLLQNVVAQHDVNDVALSRSIVSDPPQSFSIMLDDWSVTNQAKSGRCWMFAGLNVCRTDTRNLLNV